MSTSVPPSDADVAKAQLMREAERQRLLLCERMSLWREAVVECLALAARYGAMAELGASVEDDAVFKHAMTNFIYAAREASSIYREFRPRAPGETGAKT